MAFLEYRAEYLDELLWLDGRGGNSVLKCCPGELRNSDSDVMYRCLDCVGIRSFCQTCIVRAHKHHPLHRIEVRRSFSITTTILNLNILGLVRVLEKGIA